MKLLQDYASVLSGLLKDQLFQEGVSYRLMHYVIQQPVEKGMLLYNVLTRAVVFLSTEEVQKIEMSPSYIPGLVSKWFAVPLDHDDRKLAREVRSVGKMLEKRPNVSPTTPSLRLPTATPAVFTAMRKVFVASR